MKTLDVKHMASSAVLGAGFWLAVLTADAQVLAQHLGSTDPTAEGWEILGPGVDAGAVDDGGVPAWFTDDDSTSSGTFTIYTKTLSQEQFADAETRGWKMRSILRVVDGPVDGRGSTSIGFSRATDEFLLFFGQQADGDPVLFPWSEGPGIPLEGLGPGYHAYEMVFDPGLQSVDVFVNGVERFSDYEGYAIGGNAHRVAWGAGAGAFTGQGNFNLVEFAVVPEPQEVAFVLSGGLACFAAWHYRRRNSRHSLDAN